MLPARRRSRAQSASATIGVAGRDAGASRPRQDARRSREAASEQDREQAGAVALADHRRQRQAVGEDAHADHDQHDADQEIGELHRLSATVTATPM